MKCNFCGKIIKHSLVVANGDNYCSAQCLEDWTTLEKHLKKGVTSENITSEEKCSYCDKNIFIGVASSILSENGYYFCNDKCLCAYIMNQDRTQEEVKKRKSKQIDDQQKHEKIERMAFKLFRDIQMVLAPKGAATIESIPKLLNGAWIRAEAFYNYAKEKEEGANE